MSMINFFKMLLFASNLFVFSQGPLTSPHPKKRTPPKNQVTTIPSIYGHHHMTKLVTSHLWALGSFQ